MELSPKSSQKYKDLINTIDQTKLLFDQDPKFKETE